MKLKVCGLTKMNQVYLLDEMGIDYAGFIFYEGSRRRVSQGDIDPLVMKIEKFKMLKLGVFVDAGYDHIMKAVDDFGLDLVQLHGKETMEFCDKLNQQVGVIKSFSMTGDPLTDVNDYKDVAEFFLMDSHSGGSGEKFDWKKLDGMEFDRPFFLAGGIGEEDAALIRDLIDKGYQCPYAIDINSRFETEPGVKDINKIRRFKTEINAIKKS